LPLLKAGTPQIHFPPYTRLEAISTVAQQPPPLPDYEHDLNIDDLQRTWQAFVLTTYDSLAGPTSTSLAVFEALCQKLWPRFIWPAVSRLAPAGKKRQWDYGTLLVRNRGLFQQEGELAMQDKLQMSHAAWTFEVLRQQATTGEIEQPPMPTTPSKRQAKATTQLAKTPLEPPLLSQSTALLLVASYLASHTPIKQDIILFSRLSTASLTKGGKVRRTPKKSPFKSPSKSTALGTAPQGWAAGGEAKMAPRTKNIFDLKFGAPKPFSLERVLAITRAIHPRAVGRQKGLVDDIHTGMSELDRLRLVAMVDSEEIESGGRWRINVSRERVAEIGKRHGLGLSEWEIEEQ
jgi:origin recognition complex subunit 5